MSMLLQDYLQEQRVSIQEFADGVGVTHEAARRYLNGQRRPSREVLGRIITLTGGRVTADSFVPELARRDRQVA